MEELTEKAQDVRKELNGLETEFKSFESNWSTFYDSHLSNLTGKADDLNSDFRNLRARFDEINLER